ncbi:uncharacterized protein EHS24_001481 [Apiotrichum porosum]|uniref:Uncharacterized protein n=1 Tax=Apiotrichum porosum TaxID=105984 RepID=A0A427XL07_9TREE|nr:uncharacterized protein EHS24_001481 [Apiotrichum porosum]RSH79434.1 hypothetical protein EHS24_001481 [Apiotrichum porosum]
MVMLALTYPGYQPPYQPLSVQRPGYYFDNFYNDAYLQEPYYPEPFYRPNLYSSYNAFNNYRDTMYNPYNTKPYNVSVSLGYVHPNHLPQLQVYIDQWLSAHGVSVLSSQPFTDFAGSTELNFHVNGWNQSLRLDLANHVNYLRNCRGL